MPPRSSSSSSGCRSTCRRWATWAGSSRSPSSRRCSARSAPAGLQVGSAASRAPGFNAGVALVARPVRHPRPDCVRQLVDRRGYADRPRRLAGPLHPRYRDCWHVLVKEFGGLGASAIRDWRRNLMPVDGYSRDPPSRRRREVRLPNGDRWPPWRSSSATTERRDLLLPARERRRTPDRHRAPRRRGTAAGSGDRRSVRTSEDRRRLSWRSVNSRSNGSTFRTQARGSRRTLAELGLRAKTGRDGDRDPATFRPVSGAQPGDVIQQGDTLVAVEPGSSPSFGAYSPTGRSSPRRRGTNQRVDHRSLHICDVAQHALGLLDFQSPDLGDDVVGGVGDPGHWGLLPRRSRSSDRDPRGRTSHPLGEPRLHARGRPAARSPVPGGRARARVESVWLPARSRGRSAAPGTNSIARCSRVASSRARIATSEKSTPVTVHPRAAGSGRSPLRRTRDRARDPVRDGRSRRRGTGSASCSRALRLPILAIGLLTPHEGSNPSCDGVRRDEREGASRRRRSRERVAVGLGERAATRQAGPTNSPNAHAVFMTPNASPCARPASARW